MTTVSTIESVPGWLQPGVGLMQRLRMSVKLTTLALLVLVPLLVATFFLIAALVNDYLTASTSA
ncbi:MAG: hypothetical protein ACR2I0_05650, partial [Rhodoferax sp.]